MADQLGSINSELRIRELRGDAERWRLAHRRDAGLASAVPQFPSTLVIRMARPDDDPALSRLAELEGRPPLEHSRLLVAELEHEVLAALPLDGTAPVSDPFRPTAQLVEMLKLRAASLGARPPRQGLRAWLSRLRGKARGRPASAPVTPGNAAMLVPRD